MSYCPAIDHGVAVFPDGKIRPCCQASADYSKPMSEINNPDRFADLRVPGVPDACRGCHQQEVQNRVSYRKFFLDRATSAPGIQFVDLRHSNQCNLKCRYCGPHFSNQWARELGYTNPLQCADIEQYYDSLLTPSLTDMYWCGGEPLIIKDHYQILNSLIESGLSKNINLRYNTNLTVLQYKDINIDELWRQFKSVNLLVSIDAAGPELDLIRSGSSWTAISKNIELLTEKTLMLPNLKISFAPTVSILNVWFLPRLFEYAQSKKIPVELNILHGPDYLSLGAIYSDELKQLARASINAIKTYIPLAKYNEMTQYMLATDNEYLFNHAVRHILLLDSVRNEKLFELLPFKKTALALTASNKEYE